MAASAVSLWEELVSEEIWPEAAREYADRVSALLVGLVPVDRRERLRSEIAEHVTSAAEELTGTGLEPCEAMRRALREFGDAESVAESFYESWSGRCSRRVLGLDAFALAAFAGPLVLASGFLQVRAWAPGVEASDIAVPSVLFYGLAPSVLTTPELGWATSLALVLVLMGPWVGGWLVGRRHAFRAGRRAAGVLAFLCVVAGLSAAGMWPLSEGVLLGLVVLVYWLPVGVWFSSWVSLVARSNRTGGLGVGG